MPSTFNRLVEGGGLEKLGGVYRFHAHPYDERLEIAGGFQPACFAFIPLVFCTSCPISCLPNSTLPFPKNHVPDYPPVKLYFWETTAFRLGVSDFHLEEGNIRAYDPEKAVCDLFRSNRCHRV